MAKCLSSAPSALGPHFRPLLHVQHLPTPLDFMTRVLYLFINNASYFQFSSSGHYNLLNVDPLIS